MVGKMRARGIEVSARANGSACPRCIDGDDSAQHLIGLPLSLFEYSIEKGNELTLLANAVNMLRKPWA